MVKLYVNKGSRDVAYREAKAQGKKVHRSSARGQFRPPRYTVSAQGIAKAKPLLVSVLYLLIEL